MSNKSIGWALEQDGLTPTVKLLLVAMADSISDSGKSFSANRTLCRICGFSKEDTVSEGQRRLCERGLIADTGRRTGNTGRIKVFQFPQAACKVELTEEELGVFPNPPLNGGFNPPRIPRESPANPPFDGERLKKGTGNGEKGTGSGCAAPLNFEERAAETKRAFGTNGDSATSLPKKPSPVRKVLTSAPPAVRPKPAAFQKPTRAEVEQFCISIGLEAEDGTVFYWKKEGTGWRDGHNAIKDWKATVRSWEAQGWMKSQKQEREENGRRYVRDDNPHNFSGLSL